MSVNKFISDTVQQHWAKNHFPLLVSELGSRLSEEHKSELNLSLKKWLQQNEVKIGIKVVSHPTIAAKIGLIPRSENFSFENNETDFSNELRGLLIILEQKLSIDELASIKIPANVVIKLLK